MHFAYVCHRIMCLLTLVWFSVQLSVRLQSFCAKYIEPVSTQERVVVVVEGIAILQDPATKDAFFTAKQSAL